jgi:hypothetical protein
VEVVLVVVAVVSWRCWVVSGDAGGGGGVVGGGGERVTAYV